MKKRLIKATLVVAAIALTSTASLVAYGRYQKAQFAAANPLFAENLSAIADPSSSGSSQSSQQAPMGPALKIEHEWKTRIKDIDRDKAQEYFSRYGSNAYYVYLAFCNDYYPEKFLEEGEYIPSKYQDFVIAENKRFFKAERVEAPGGTFKDCHSMGYTSVSEDGRPRAGIYLTRASYEAEFK